MDIEEAKRIVQAYGEFCAEKGLKSSLIRDVSLLPYPKEIIVEAQEKCINLLNNATDPQEKQLRSSLIFTLSMLDLYPEIEPQDREIVTYFNQFKSMDAVPKERKKECMDLQRKYVCMKSGEVK